MQTNEELAMLYQAIAEAKMEARAVKDKLGNTVAIKLHPKPGVV